MVIAVLVLGLILEPYREFIVFSSMVILHIAETDFEVQLFAI